MCEVLNINTVQFYSNVNGPYPIFPCFCFALKSVCNICMSFIIHYSLYFKSFPNIQMRLLKTFEPPVWIHCLDSLAVMNNTFSVSHTVVHILSDKSLPGLSPASSL